MRFVIVASEDLDAFVSSQGEIGLVVARFRAEREARSHARRVACEYRYGVEIVDADTCEIVDTEQTEDGQ